jgi:hypothetical protein
MVCHWLPCQVCIVFGRAVIIRVFDRTGEDAVIVPMTRESIMMAYHDLRAHNILEEGCKPIKRRSLIVMGYDTEVMIDVMEGEDGNDR